MKNYSVQEINAILQGEIIGSTSQKISSPEQLELATNIQISFIGNKKYEKFWALSNAPIAIVNSDISIAPGINRAFIKVKNADLAMTQILSLFAQCAPKLTNLFIQLL